jgi:hypothetical protein
VAVGKGSRSGFFAGVAASTTKPAAVASRSGRKDWWVRPRTSRRESASAITSVSFTT